MAKREILTDEELARAAGPDSDRAFGCASMTNYCGEDAMFDKCFKCGCDVFFIDKFMADARKVCPDCALELLSKLKGIADEETLAEALRQTEMLKRGTTR